jgi:phospholipase/carboxylesterase
VGGYSRGVRARTRRSGDVRSADEPPVRVDEASSRRAFLRAAGAWTVGALALTTCGGSPFDQGNGRIGVSPTTSGRAPTPQPGLQGLGDPGEDLGLLYVPPTLRASGSTPVMVCFHGASGKAEGGMRLFRRYADARRIVVAAPQSAGADWDLIVGGGFGVDVERIGRAIDWLAPRFEIDPAHLASAGFSDGASYSLSFGLSNGDLFSHVIALSPGFFEPGELTGDPPVFVAHGTEDRVLPIDETSRRIVPELRQRGYGVTFYEFEGRHHPDLSATSRALYWFLGTQATNRRGAARHVRGATSA